MILIGKTRECKVTELHHKLVEIVKPYIGNDDQILYCSETSVGLIPKRSAQIITPERLIRVRHDPIERDSGSHTMKLTNIGNISVKMHSLTYSEVWVYSNEGNQSIFAGFGSKQAADRFATILRQAVERGRT